MRIRGHTLERALRHQGKETHVVRMCCTESGKIRGEQVSLPDAGHDIREAGMPSSGNSDDGWKQLLHSCFRVK